MKAFCLYGSKTPSILNSTLDGGVRTEGIRKSVTKTRMKEEKMESKK
jgi:hypothetical protein